MLARRFQVAVALALFSVVPRPSAATTCVNPPPVVTSEVSVQVYTPDGLNAGVSPAKGATVTLTAATVPRRKVVSAETKADGFLALEGIAPGWYTLEIRVEGFVVIPRDIRVMRRGEAPARTIVELMAVSFSCPHWCEVVSVNGPLAAPPECLVPKASKPKR